MGIACNTARSHCRQTKQQAAEILVENVNDSLMPGNDRWISQLENENWLDIAFQRLSADQRAVLELTYWYGMHYKEIAEVMQCPENTVKTTWQCFTDSSGNALIYYLMIYHEDQRKQ